VKWRAFAVFALHALRNSKNFFVVKSLANLLAYHPLSASRGGEQELTRQSVGDDLRDVIAFCEFRDPEVAQFSWEEEAG